MTVKVNLTKEELELILETVSDYRWTADFPNDELDKMKRKLKYHINRYTDENKYVKEGRSKSNKDVIEQWRSIIDDV